MNILNLAQELIDHIVLSCFDHAPCLSLHVTCKKLYKSSILCMYKYKIKHLHSKMLKDLPKLMRTQSTYIKNNNEVNICSIIYYKAYKEYVKCITYQFKRETRDIIEWNTKYMNETDILDVQNITCVTIII